MSKAKPKLPQIYFDWNKEKFWCGGLVPDRFIPQTEPKIKNRYQMAGVHTEHKNDQGLSVGDEILRKAEVENGVDYAAPLAGYKSGLHHINGRKILVTESVKPIAPGKSKKMPWFEKFFDELLSHHEYQIDVFLSWLKIAYESLLRGDFMPGQFLALGGGDGCGKSYLQWLITHLFGGRAADPYKYMAELTTFNEELAWAEHLRMGDKKGSFNQAVRKAFAAQIKEFCVETEMSIHGKNKTASFLLPTFRRVTLSFNDEPEHAVIIPPLDSDMRRKITILKCNVATLDKDRMKNQSRFLPELPALARFLTDYEIPKNLRDDRFGVIGWQHPYFVQLLNDAAPEMQFLEIIDEAIFGEVACTIRRNKGELEPNNDPDLWRGSAESLKTELLQSKHYESIRRLLDWTPNAAGMLMDKLARKFPDRFERKKNTGRTVWILQKEKTHA